MVSDLPLCLVNQQLMDFQFSAQWHMVVFFSCHSYCRMFWCLICMVTQMILNSIRWLLSGMCWVPRRRPGLFCWTCLVYLTLFVMSCVWKYLCQLFPLPTYSGIPLFWSVWLFLCVVVPVKIPFLLVCLFSFSRYVRVSRYPSHENVNIFFTPLCW